VVLPRRPSEASTRHPESRTLGVAGRRILPLVVALLGLAPCPGPPDPVAADVVMRACWDGSSYGPADEMVATVGAIGRATDGVDIWPVLQDLGELRGPATAGELAGQVAWPTLPTPCLEAETQTIVWCPPTQVLYLTDLHACRAGCCGGAWGGAPAPVTTVILAP